MHTCPCDPWDPKLYCLSLRHERWPSKVQYVPKKIKRIKKIVNTYTQSVLIRNGPIRSTSEILAFFKKSPVELSKLRNGEITFQIFKKCTSESFQFKKWSRIPVSRSIS